MTDAMAQRNYSVKDVLSVSCRMAQIEMSQVISGDRDPEWAYMAREAVSGVIYELCNISYPELTKLLGHTTHSTSHGQVKRFRERWPRHMRRSWIEAVIVRLEGDSK